jgi:hypothetical protein
MPETTVPPPVPPAGGPRGYADEHVLLAVDPPTPGRATIRLRLANAGLGSIADLTPLGASRLSSMLADAVTTAHGLPVEGRPR